MLTASDQVSTSHNRSLNSRFRSDLAPTHHRPHEDEGHTCATTPLRLDINIWASFRPAVNLKRKKWHSGNDKSLWHTEGYPGQNTSEKAMQVWKVFIKHFCWTRDAFKTKGRLAASIENLSSKVSSLFTRPDRSQMHSSTSFHPTKMLKVGTA